MIRATKLAETEREKKGVKAARSVRGGDGMERKPSEIITQFLKFLESAKDEYETAHAAVGAEEKKEQTFLHDLEFAPDKNERNKVATRFQQSRRARRKAKDRAQLYEYISNFYTDKQNQNLVKALRRLQNEQITREKYLFGNREFKNRVD